MILITSGAYLVDEFISEVGLLPPSFLPIGNKRLYTYQIELLKQLNDKIFLSVPEDYKISQYDRNQLEILSITLIHVPENLSLSASILYCYGIIGGTDEEITILHGDTLLSDFDLTVKNCISVHDNKGLYKRGVILQDNDFSNDFMDKNGRVISGYFSFSDPKLLIQSLKKMENNFVKALANYHKHNPLQYNMTGKWLDFGHINSFFQARSEMTTERAFNSLKINKRFIQKSSQDNIAKIQSEAEWFDRLPHALRLHTPAFLGIENKPYTYKLEYLYLLPLSDLMVFCNLKSENWKIILTACQNVLHEFSAYRPDTFDLSACDEMYLKKTEKRLLSFQEQSGFDVTHQFLSYRGERLGSLFDIMKQSAGFISKSVKDDICISHGDFCFSNILFDSRVQAVKVIDPRGIDNNGNISIYGDARYDIAKLYHSLIGLYDFIISGRYSLTEENHNYEIHFFDTENISNYAQEYKDIFLYKYPEKEILAITIHLFLSMLPMHYDRPDRQKAFIANALRLYLKLIEEK